MKKEDLFEVIESIDEKYIETADDFKPAKKRNVLGKWIATAACLCLIFGTISVFSRLNSSNSKTDNGGDESSQYSNGNNMEDLEGEEDTFSKQLISSYGKSNENGDYAVNNGSFVLSESLQAAINEYTSEANYRVLVVIFKDGVAIDTKSDELEKEGERLTVDGYSVVYENYNDGYVENKLLSLNATMNQLVNFIPNEKYGYSIMLYDEYFDRNSQDSTVNSDSSVQDAPSDYDGTVPDEATVYPNDIIELQDKISKDMASGQLPFVTSSSILENPLRLEITVITQDEELINKIKAYDPESKYITVVQHSGAYFE